MQPWYSEFLAGLNPCSDTVAAWHSTQNVRLHDLCSLPISIPPNKPIDMVGYLGVGLTMVPSPSVPQKRVPN